MDQVHRAFLVHLAFLFVLYWFRIRGAFLAVCTVALWPACFLLTYSFLLLNSSLGTAGYLLDYAVVFGLVFLFALRPLPKKRLITCGGCTANNMQFISPGVTGPYNPGSPTIDGGVSNGGMDITIT
jgi:hypothetical protein